MMTSPVVTGEATIAAAVGALRRGLLVVFPTETIYGIGCDALDAGALARLCAAKRRPGEKGIAVILGDATMLEQITPSVDPAARTLIERFWPGPLTLLFTPRPGLPAALVQGERIGARVSSHAIARRLSQELGRPIAAPSANPADAEPARDVRAARAYFGDAVAAYVDAGGISGPPSTLVDPGPPLRVLRAGAVPEEAVREALARQDGATLEEK
jgi:L-threonylcarbamoyladenylate synthase